jgi:anti-sigma regulatory factor (Ser/Thr protein kinase)
MVATTSIVVHAETIEIPRAMSGIEECLESGGFSEEDILDMQLAVEEAITNTIRYGYAGAPGTIAIRCTVEPDRATVEIADDAPAFDPLKVPEPDLSADLDDRPIGGLGIFLLRKVMDDVAYRFADNQNILVLVKRKEAADR